MIMKTTKRVKPRNPFVLEMIKSRRNEGPIRSVKREKDRIRKEILDELDD